MKTDKEIQDDVMEELKCDASVDATGIAITVSDGIVTMLGEVPGYGQKASAERAAKRVYGVRGVADELEVKLPDSSLRSDSQIVAAALEALKWHASVPDEQIKVTVNRGWVTLEGGVEWQYQKDAALDAVRHLTGVRGVVNMITLAPRVMHANVKNAIYRAFERNADLDARRVGVKARDGLVVLHGNVHSWTEHDEATRAALSVPGVREVDNELIVMP